MPDPFKNRFSPALINDISEHFRQHFTGFDQNAFIHQASFQLETLELKARVQQITLAMTNCLPDVSLNNFNDISMRLIKCLTPTALIDQEKAVSGGEVSEHGIEGWAIMPIADYIAFSYLRIIEQMSTLDNNVKAKDNAFTIVMHTLKEMTKRFSVEFAIRHIIKAEPQKSIALMTQWTNDENYHVRRLASEGSRPRLPWGIQLSHFVDDPTPLLPLLNALKDDDELYVRRSVANNINDIAKDHVELVADLATTWLNEQNEKNAKHRLQLVKHACRTLIKQGNETVLEALGYSKVKLSDAKLTLSAPLLTFGHSIDLSLTLISNHTSAQEVTVDYIVHHQKANGTTSPKVFKWKSATLMAKQPLHLIKKHTIKAITTRVYYSGAHKIEILVNGDVVCSNVFELVMPN